MRESPFLSNLFVEVKNKKSNKQTKTTKNIAYNLCPQTLTNNFKLLFLYDVVLHLGQLCSSLIILLS